uniref:Uncharacterized protein n=1 Tax=Anguilla anguilla TaxID=7936 RepID=A0A0E9UFW3_ANGAN
MGRLEPRGFRQHFYDRNFHSKTLNVWNSTDHRGESKFGMKPVT